MDACLATASGLDAVTADEAPRALGTLTSRDRWLNPTFLVDPALFSAFRTYGLGDQDAAFLRVSLARAPAATHLRISSDTRASPSKGASAVSGGARGACDCAAVRP